MEFTPVESLLSKVELPRKGTPCVYLLKDIDGVIFYAGQTTNIRNRLKKHSNAKADFKYYYCKEVSLSQLNNRETGLISTHKPRDNKRIPTNDFYITKGTLKKQLEIKISEFIRSLDYDFHIETKEKYQVYHLNAYKGLICNSAIEDLLSELTKNLKELSNGS